MTFSVTLDTYRGPLDLLLFLVRRHEVEIIDIPIAQITQQYLDYLKVLETLDVDAVGDFLELASVLVEIKSRQMLPQADEDQEPLDDPRGQLVEQLLEYKKYKDAASVLEERSRQWQTRYARLADDLPPRRVDPADQPIQEIELWDLVSAFGRIMRDSRAAQPASIVYDDTPIHVHMERIHQRLVTHGRVAFSEMFEPGMPKATLIGVFLAVLELARHHGVQTHQEEQQGEIWLSPGAEFTAHLDLSAVDEYDATGASATTHPAQPR